MRTRTHLLLLIIAALLASAVGSLAAVAGTAGTAHACSIAGPYAEVWPSTDLQPGQQVEIVGWGFNDIQMNEPQPQLVAPGDGDNAVPPELCDFTVSPISSLDVYWRGAPTAWLGTVAGPDFATTVAVPLDALPGPATIAIGSFEVVVSVGQTIEIPPPCPLTMHPDGTISHVCPEPWPCPYASSSGTQPAPGAGVAPGSQFPCPEPCVDAAHTIDDGTVYDYQWDCPEPCNSLQVDPGAVQSDSALWCPPPEPCPVYAAGDTVQSDAALWCPPPEPCPVYLHGGPAEPQPSLVNCPDPCQVVGGDAVWCPPVDPCGDYPTNAAAGQSELSVWCPPIDPCPVYLHDGPVDAESSLVYCPDPCQVVGGDAVWCPPGPCHLVGGDALVCPTAAEASSAQDTTVSDQAVGAQPAPAPVSAEQAVAAQTVSNLVAEMTQRLRTMAGVIVASILG